jgi:hypothetical protein
MGCCTQPHDDARSASIDICHALNLFATLLHVPLVDAYSIYPELPRSVNVTQMTQCCIKVWADPN